ncbi:MAG: hypothetical protein WCI22_09890 [Actinomycetota bacterium]
MLAFCTALAIIEVGAGAVVAEAWKLHHDRPMLTIDERMQLHSLLERLRIMEGVIAGGVVAATLLWSFLATNNAARVTRSTRSMMFATAAWVLTPVLLVGIGRFERPDAPVQATLILMVLRAIALYLPFGTLATASWRVGGPRSPFLRWYLGVVLAFGVHKVFTGSIDLLAPKPGDDLGRTAALYFVNAVVVAVIVLMASEASRAMQDATKARAKQHDLLCEEAFSRLQSRGVTDLPALTDTL